MEPSRVWALLAVLSTGCGATVDSSGHEVDSSTGDTGAEVRTDSNGDVTEDRPEAAGADVPTDRAPDAPRDATADAARDAPADAPGDAPRDAGSDTGADTGADVPPSGVVLYPSDRMHSPLTADLAAGLREAAARRSNLRGDVFSKVGASNTGNTNFVGCFSGSAVDLAGREHLRPTLDALRGGDAGGTDPFRRVSLAATVGWSAWAALAGSPSPLTRELDATRARMATVMFGTNDIQSRDIVRYGQNLLDIADQSLARGVIPLFTTIPPRDDDPAADLWVPRYTAVMRAVAQTRGVPLIDAHRALVALPGHGLGPDGLHLEAYTTSAGARGCVFTAEGLRHGHNVRNLATLEALDRVRSALGGAPAPDATAPRLVGLGTPESPFVIPWRPFGDSRNTATGGVRALSRYGCRPTADESGAEFYYRLTLARPTRVRALVVTRGSVDVDLHVLTGGLTADRCALREDRMLVADLAAGTHHLVVDTYVPAGGAPLAGEYLLVVVDDG